jgi:hypothetical protein
MTLLLVAPLMRLDAADEAKPATNELAFVSPATWKEGKASPFRVVSLAARDGKVDVSVTRFPAGQGGSFKDNLNRWRMQLGLPPLDKADRADFPVAKVDGSEGRRLDLSGGPAGDAKRMIVVEVIHGDLWWVVKMMGPAADIAAETDAFDQFLKSVRFPKPPEK